MFTIKKAKFGQFEKITILNRKTEEYVDIIPAYGGNIIELVYVRVVICIALLMAKKAMKNLLKIPVIEVQSFFRFQIELKMEKYSINGMNYMFPVNHEEENK